MIPIDKTKIVNNSHDEGDEDNGLAAYPTHSADRWHILFILVIIIGCFLERR